MLWNTLQQMKSMRQLSVPAEKGLMEKANRASVQSDTLYAQNRHRYNITDFFECVCVLITIKGTTFFFESLYKICP